MNTNFLRIGVIFLFSLIQSIPAQADQGMWLPHLLKQLNEERMQELGMQMTAEDIYSINNGSLKDAIVSFSGYCTGQVISDQGLLLTNHHCGYGAIQSHSSVENDLLTNGFWAMSSEEEIPSPGIFATFIVRIEDVTAKILDGVSGTMSTEEREAQIDVNTAAVAAAAEAGTHYEALIRPFYAGAEYYMFITERYDDVRLVGAPPSFIGKYGGDTDNWEWPRHTGDFSMFRIYSAPDGSPAPYSADNVPLRPRRSLNISLGGVEAGDFTMVFGFPGRTQQFLTSEAVRLLVEETNPHRIGIREAKMDILSRHMGSSDAIRIQYASKYARLANYWKKWIGESMGLERYDAIAVKQKQEAEFAAWVAEEDYRQARYGDEVDRINALVSQKGEANIAYQYLREGLTGLDSYRYLVLLNNIAGAMTEEDRNELIAEARDMLEDIDVATEQDLVREMIRMYGNEVPEAYRLRTLGTAGDPTTNWFSGDWLSEAWLNERVDNPEQLIEDFALLRALPMAIEIQEMMDKVTAELDGPEEEIDALTKRYIQGLREMNPDRPYAPDANSTMRVAYGQVGGMEPADGLIYRHYTTLEGVLDKEVADVQPSHEFYLDDRYRELGLAADYGRWADEEGYLPVNFLASNHSTGGNSGSPVIDAEGNLIGLNFDRTWQSTMSDVMYNGEICRNIAVDVRYIMWVVDKYAGASHLIEEINFVNE